MGMIAFIISIFLKQKYFLKVGFMMTLSNSIAILFNNYSLRAELQIQLLVTYIKFFPFIF